MKVLKPIDPFVCTDEIDFEIDEETLAAIDRGIRDADAGRTVSAAEARRLLKQWNSELNIPSRR